MLGGRKSVFVGNSMGAYASLLTSATFPDVSRGLVLVNGAGRFDEVKAAVEAAAETVLDQETLKSTVQEVGHEPFSLHKNISKRGPALTYHHVMPHSINVTGDSFTPSLRAFRYCNYVVFAICGQFLMNFWLLSFSKVRAELGGQSVMRLSYWDLAVLPTVG